MPSRIYKKVRGLGRNTVILNGVINCGASGAVSSGQDCDGFTVTQTADKDGRFTIALVDTYLKIMNIVASLEISSDAAAIQAKGIIPILRGVSESGRVAYLQFSLAPTAAAAGADADVQDNAKLRLTVFCDGGKT